MTNMDFLRLANVIISGFVFFVGAIVASFWAVVAERQLQGRDWVRGRSECDWCHHRIAWWQNIPVLSYLLLRGRCYYCHKKIRISYFIWECLLGLWSVVWLWTSVLAPYLDATNLDLLPPFGSQAAHLAGLASGAAWWALGAVLIWTAVVDVQTHQIANGWLVTVAVLTLARLALGVATGALTLDALVPAALGSVAVMAIFVLIDQVALRIWRRPGIGWGDTLMVALLAWWLTPGQLVMMFLGAFWLGAAVGVVWLGWARAHRVATKNLTLAFLPFINLAFGLSFYFGQEVFAALLARG